MAGQGSATIASALVYSSAATTRHLIDKISSPNGGADELQQAQLESSPSNHSVAIQSLLPFEVSSVSNESSGLGIGSEDYGDSTAASNYLATSNNNTAIASSQQQPQQPELQLFLPLFALLVSINLIVILGNILVILAVHASAKLRNVTNIFIVSLATADLLLGLFVLPYALVYEVLDVWVFGEVWCRGWLVTDVWISTASILNLCAISIDRYVAVTRPVKYRSIMTNRRAKCIVAIVWILAFIICLPPLLTEWTPSGPSSVSSSSSSSSSLSSRQIDDAIGQQQQQQPRPQRSPLAQLATVPLGLASDRVRRSTNEAQLFPIPDTSIPPSLASSSTTESTRTSRRHFIAIDSLNDAQRTPPIVISLIGPRDRWTSSSLAAAAARGQQNNKNNALANDDSLDYTGNERASSRGRGEDQVNKRLDGNYHEHHDRGPETGGAKQVDTVSAASVAENSRGPQRQTRATTVVGGQLTSGPTSSLPLAEIPSPSSLEPLPASSRFAKGPPQRGADELEPAVPGRQVGQLDSEKTGGQEKGEELDTTSMAGAVAAVTEPTVEGRQFETSAESRRPRKDGDGSGNETLTTRPLCCSGARGSREEAEEEEPKQQEQPASAIVASASFMAGAQVAKESPAIETAAPLSQLPLGEDDERRSIIEELQLKLFKLKSKLKLALELELEEIKLPFGLFIVLNEPPTTSAAAAETATQVKPAADYHMSNSNNSNNNDNNESNDNNKHDDVSHKSLRLLVRHWSLKDCQNCSVHELVAVVLPLRWNCSSLANNSMGRRSGSDCLRWMRSHRGSLSPRPAKRRSGPKDEAGIGNRQPPPSQPSAKHRGQHRGRRRPPPTGATRTRTRTTTKTGTGTNRTARSGARRTTRSLGADFGASGTQRKTSGGEENPSVINGDNNNNSTTSGKIQAANMSRKWPGLVGLCFRFGGTSSVDEVEEEALDKRQTNNNDDDSSARGPLAAGGTTARQWRAGCLLHLMARLDFQKATNDEKGPPPTDGGRHQSIVSMDGARGAAHRLALALVVPLLAPNSSSMGCISTGPRDSEAGQCQCLALIGGSRRRELGQADARQEVEAGFNYSDLSSANAEAKNEPIAGQNEPQELVVKTVPHADYNTPSRTNKDRSAASGPNDLGTWEREQESGGGQVDELQGSLKELAEGDEQQEPKAGVRRVLPVIPDSSGPAGNQSVAVANVPGLQANLAERQLRNASARNEMTTNTTQPRVVVTAATTTPTLPEEAVGSEHFTSNRKMDSRRAAAERVVAVLSSGEQERIISSRANTKGARKEHDDEQQQHEQDEQEKQDQICCAAATVGTLSYSAAHVIVPEQDDDDDQQHEDCDLAALVELRRCHCLDTTASSSQTSNGKASRRCTSLNLDPESLAGAVHFLLEGPASSPVLYVHSVCKDAAAKIETSALSNREWPLAELLASSDNDKGGRLKACPEIGFVTVARLEATPIRGAGPNGIDYGRADKASGQHSSAAKKEEEASASEAAMKPTEAAPDLDPDLDLDSGFGRRPRRLNQEKPVLKSERPRRIVDNGIRENKERQARRGAPRHPLFRSRDVKMDHLLEAISSLAIGPAEEEEAAAARLATGSNDRTGTKAAPRAKTFVAPAANNEVQQSEQSESQSQKQQQRRGRHKHDPKNTNNNRKEKHDDDDDDDVNDYFGATQRARRAPIQSPVHGWHPRAHYPRVATLANSPQAGDETTRPAGLAGAPQLERPKGPRLVRATMMTRTTRTLGPVPVDVVGQAAIMSSLEYEQVAGSRPEGRAARSDPVNGQRPVGYVYGAGLQADSRSQVPPASASASASGARARVVELEKRDIDSKEEEEDVVSVQDDLVAAAAASNDDATSSTTGATTTPTKHTAQRYPMSEQAQTNASRRREKSGCTLFHDKTYVVYSALGSFFIPMLIMVFFYSRIYLVASRAQKAMQRGYMTTKWPPMTTHKSTANNNNHMRQQQGGPMGAGGGGKRKNWPRGSSFKRSSMIRASASTLRSSRTNSNENSASLITAGSHYNHHPESLSGGGQDPGGLGAEQASHECQPPERVMLRIHRRTEPPPQPQPQPQPQLQTSSLNSLQQKANSADLNYAGKMGVGANQQRQPITVAARLLRAISSDVSQDQTTSGVNKSSGLMALIVAEQQMALKRSGERRTRFSLDRTGESSGGSSAGRPTTGRQADEATLNQGQGFQPTRKRSSLPPAIKIAESALVNQLYEQEMNREQSELNRDNELTQVETTANQEPAAQIDASTELDQMRTISSPAAESGPSVGPDEGKESGRHHSSKHHNHHHHHHHHHHHRHHQNHHHHHHHHNRSHNHSNNNHKPDREDKRSPESTNLASSNLNGPPPSAGESIPQNSRQPDSANSIRITIEDASDSVQTRTEDDQTQAPEGDTASAPNGNGVASKEHWQSDNGSAQYGPMPTIVVNWDPESGQAASQLVAVAKEASSATTTPNTTNGRQLLASMPALQLLNDNNDDDVDVNVDGNQTHLDRLANVRIGFGTACSSPAYKRSLKEAHGLGSEDAEQGPHHHHHHQSYSGSGLSLVANIPQQVRKQSMMLLSSLTSRSGQTLRRLSMAAAHPVDTFLLKSRSSGPAGHRAAAGGGDHRRRRHRRRSSCSSNSSAATAASSSYLSTSCYSSTSVSSEAELDSIGGGGQKRPAARAGGITSRRSRAAAGSTLGDEQGPTEPTSGGSSTARPEHEGQPSERRRLFGGGSGKRRNNRNKRDKHSSLGNTSPMGPKKTLDDYLMAVAGIDTSSDEQDDDDDGDDDDVGDDEEDDDDDDSSMSSSSSSSTSSSSSSTFSGASNLTAMLRRENLLIPTIAIVSPDSDHSGSRLTLHELNAEPRSVASGANTNKLAKTCANDDKIDRDASSATNTTTTTTRAGQGCAPERAGQNHMEQKHDNLGSSLEKQVKRAEQLPPSAGLHRQGGLYESATSLRQSMQTSTNSTGLVTGTGIAGGTDDADKAQEVVVTAAGGKEPANHRHEPTTTLANESRPQTRSPDLFRLLDPRTRRELGAAKSGQLNATGGPSSRALVARVASSASGVTSSLISAQKITGGSSVTTGGGGAASAAATRRRGLKRTSRWHAKRLRAETKAAKTVAIIVGGFIFCWLPFFTAYLWRAIVCSSPNCIPQTWLSLSIWLGYMNSAINPVIYGLFSADFRQAFKSIVCRCRLRGHSHSPHHLHQHQQAAGNDTAVVSMLVDGILKSFL